MFPLSERKCFSSVVFLLLSLSVLWLASRLCLWVFTREAMTEKRAARRSKKEGLERTGEIQKGWRDTDWLTEEAGEKGRNLSGEADSHRRSCTEEPFTHMHTRTHTGLFQLVVWHLIALRWQHSHAHKHALAEMPTTSSLLLHLMFQRLIIYFTFILLPCWSICVLMVSGKINLGSMKEVRRARNGHLAPSFGDIWPVFTDPGKKVSPFWVLLFAKHEEGGHVGTARSKTD